MSPYVPSHRRTVSLGEQWLLDQIAAYFVQTGEWPQLAKLKRRAAREEVELPETTHAMVRDFLWRLDHDDTVVLSVPGLARTDIGKPLAIKFIEVVQLAVQRYLADDDDDQPTIGSSDLSAVLHFDEELIARVAMLLRYEYFLTRGGNPATPTDWSYYVNEMVAQFRRVTTLDEYFEVRSTIVGPKVVTAPWRPASAGEFVFSPFESEVNVSIGDDNVIIGDPGTGGIGSRNVIIRPGAGGTVRIDGGTAIGSGAQADESSVAIGSGARAGSGALEQFDELVDRLLASPQLRDDEKSEVNAQADIVRAEVQSASPRQQVLKAAWTVIATSATVAGLAAAALEIAKALGLS